MKHKGTKVATEKCTNITWPTALAPRSSKIVRPFLPGNSSLRTMTCWFVAKCLGSGSIEPRMGGKVEMSMYQTGTSRQNFNDLQTRWKMTTIPRDAGPPADSWLNCCIYVFHSYTLACCSFFLLVPWFLLACVFKDVFKQHVMRIGGSSQVLSLSDFAVICRRTGVDSSVKHGVEKEATC